MQPTTVHDCEYTEARRPRLVVDSRLTPALRAVPLRLVRAGLTGAHIRPLAGVRGTNPPVTSRRVTPSEAWQYPLLEWARTKIHYVAVALDVDASEAIERVWTCALGTGPLPRPNVVMRRKASGHLHAVWLLRRPVYRVPSARVGPLRLYARIVEFYTRAIGAEVGYAASLTANPFHAEYETTWPCEDDGGGSYTLRALAKPLPRPAQSAEPVERLDPLATLRGRHVWLTLAGLRAAGSRRHTDDEVAAAINKLHREEMPRFALAPLSQTDVDGIIDGIIRMRDVWRRRPEGWHDPAFLARQSHRGRKSGAERRRDTIREHDPDPWRRLGVSRATWYRHRRRPAAPKW